MAQILYSPRQIELIRDAAKVVAECLQVSRELCVPGSTTRKVDEAVGKVLQKHNATSPFLGYKQTGKVPFPANICSSVNHVIVHGVPDDVEFKPGDIVSIDCGAKKNGYIGDSAWTFPVGEVDAAAKKLLKVGEESLYLGIQAAKPKGKLGEISRAIQTYVESNGFSVVREYVGHGVGLSLHEEPQVPNYVEIGALLPVIGKKLLPGTVIAIEPMVNEGVAQTKGEEKEWPVYTADGGRSVHFEHTVAILYDRVEILTKLD